jgi:hypothetical protein
MKWEGKELAEMSKEINHAVWDMVFFILDKDSRLFKEC